jgi:hypothetical protein
MPSSNAGETENVYMKVPTGGEGPYLADGWIISKKLKRQLRLIISKRCFQATCLSA